MTISEHAYKRYIERFKEITMTHQAYLAIGDNKERITNEIEKLFQYSELFYEGELMKHESKRYYIKDRCVLVENEGCIITIFKIEFPTPDDEVLKVVINGFKNKIEELDEQEKSMMEKFIINKARQDEELLNIECELEIHNIKILLLLNKKQFINDGLNIDQKEIDMISKEKFNNIEQLIGFTQFKYESSILMNKKK